MSESAKTRATVDALAQHKALDPNFLRERFGLRDTRRGVEIPYYTIDGSLGRQRLRRWTETSHPTEWLPGDGTLLYFDKSNREAAEARGELVIVEGESDVWTLTHHGIPALGVPGSSMVKTIAREDVTTIPRLLVMREPDEAGAKFLAAVAKQLHKIGWTGELFVVDLHAVHGAKDPSALHVDDPERFAERWQTAIEAARPSDEQAIARLASLAPVEYERSRGPAAKKLGMRVTTLDALVEDQRKADEEAAREARAAEEARRAEEARQAEAARATTDQPTDEAQENLAVLLDEIVAFVTKYVLMPAIQHDANALWVAHTHAFEASDTTPYIYVSSAERESGKTRLQEVDETLVCNPLRFSNVSEAALFRSIQADNPTLLFDEVDAIFGPKARDREDLRALLNDGYRKGGGVIRCVGEGVEMRTARFKTYCPKMLAGLNRGLPDTLASRCISFVMKRKKRAENVGRFRLRNARAEADVLRGRLATWASHNTEQLKERRPALPDELGDRAQDVWEALFSLAETAGGDWPTRVRTAALALSANGSIDDYSLGTRLLADCKAIFDELKADKIRSADLVEKLRERDWEARDGREFGPRDLARLLRPYKIRPGTIRMADDDFPKGYTREAFEDAFERYIPPDSTIIRNVRHNADTTGFFEPNATATEIERGGTQIAEKPCNDGVVADVAGLRDTQGPSEPGELSDRGKLCRQCKTLDLAYDMRDGTWLCKACSEAA